MCYAPCVSRACLIVTCTKCKAKRPREVVRETEGAKPPRFTCSIGDTHRYIIEASTPCSCGCRTVRMIYDMSAMLGE
jgi:hypothetical protein